MSSTQLSDCVPELVITIGAAIQRWNATYPAGPKAVIVQTKRWYSEALINYLKGRYIGGQRVTNALPEEDPHVLTDAKGRCFACDVGFVILSGPSANTMDWNSAHYEAFAKIVAELGPQLGAPLDWGGTWTTIKDEPHYQPVGWRWQDHQPPTPT